jgi:hypothetical protein
LEAEREEIQKIRQEKRQADEDNFRAFEVTDPVESCGVVVDPVAGNDTTRSGRAAASGGLR